MVISCPASAPSRATSWHSWRTLARSWRSYDDLSRSPQTKASKAFVAHLWHTRLRNAVQPGQPASTNHARNGRFWALHAGSGRPHNPSVQWSSPYGHARRLRLPGRHGLRRPVAGASCGKPLGSSRQRFGPPRPLREPLSIWGFAHLDEARSFRATRTQTDHRLHRRMSRASDSIVDQIAHTTVMRQAPLPK